jgi:hypothetical protein
METNRRCQENILGNILGPIYSPLKIFTRAVGSNE